MSFSWRNLFPYLWSTFYVSSYWNSMQSQYHQAPHWIALNQTGRIWTHHCHNHHHCFPTFQTIEPMLNLSLLPVWPACYHRLKNCHIQWSPQSHSQTSRLKSVAAAISLPSSFSWELLVFARSECFRQCLCMNHDIALVAKLFTNYYHHCMIRSNHSLTVNLPEPLQNSHVSAMQYSMRY